MEKVFTENIELTWEGGCWSGHWNAYFYDERGNRTYCVHFREGSYCWSADLQSAEGCFSGSEFEELPYESKMSETICLGFDYLSDNVLPDWHCHFSEIVEESIVYLNSRFPYFCFDSEQREKYDFMEGITEENKESRIDVLDRRAELMRMYLARYEDFKEKNNLK